MRALRNLGALAIAAFSLATAPSAHATTILYGIDHAIDQIHQIDAATGAVLGSFATPNAASLVGGLSRAENGASLIYTDSANGPLFRLDPNTGAVLSSHSLPVTNTGGLSFDSTSPGLNTIFTINDGAPVRRQAGFGGPTSTHVSVNPNFPGAMGGDDYGRHFVWANGLIREFSASTGAVLNGFQAPTGLAGLAFDGSILYATATSSSMLYHLNPNTGAVLATIRLNTGAISGLAAFDVPEPTTLALLGLGLAGLGLRSWRRLH